MESCSVGAASHCLAGSPAGALFFASAALAAFAFVGGISTTLMLAMLPAWHCSEAVTAGTMAVRPIATNFQR